MKRLWPWLLLLVVAVAVIVVAGRPRGEKQIMEWLVGPTPEKHKTNFAWSYRIGVSEGVSGVDVTYTCDVTLENLWDPFFMSGPVHSTENTFALVWRVEIEDVTNNPPHQPEWWNGEILCGDAGLGEGQIWKVTLIADLVPGGYREEIGWFWICEEAADAYHATFSVTVTDVNQLSVCRYEVTDESAYTIRFENCMDEDGNPVVLQIAAPMIPGPWAAGEAFTLSGTFESCLHKGTGGNNYVRQAMACNVYALDFDDWEEFFIGGDARGYGVGATAFWEAVNDFAATGCAAENWLCVVGGLWDPFMVEDGIGVLHRVAVTQQGIVHYAWLETHREAPVWREGVKPFGEADDHFRPSILFGGRGELVVCATHEGNMVLTRSLDLGLTWEEIPLPHIGQGLEFGSIAQRDGQTVVCGWDANKILYRISSREDLQAERLYFSDPETTLDVCDAVVVGEADKPRSQIVHSGGEIWVAVGLGGDLLTYRAQTHDDDAFGLV